MSIMEIEKELSETTKPRSWIGWLKRIGGIVLILAILAVFIAFMNRRNSVNKLQEALAELDAHEPGWRLADIEAARAEVAEEENSARVVLAAAKLLGTRPWPPKELADDHFRNLPPTARLSDEDFDLLTKELASVRPTLAIADKLADMPRGRHCIHFERNPLATTFPHVEDCRRIADLLVYEAMRRNQAGQSKDALTACRAALNAVRSIGDEPIMISQMIRSSGAIHACQAIERTLAQGEPPSEDLRELQKLLESEDAFSALPAVMRGERAMMHQLFDAAEHGEIVFNGLDITRGIGLNSEYLQRVMNALRRMDTRSDHALYLSLMTRRVKEAQQPIHAQAALETQFEKDANELPGSAMITRLSLPAVQPLGVSYRCKHALLRSAIVALAAERYRRDKKAWPDNVDQLCPQYLSAVPLDPFNGKPFPYQRLDDGVVIKAVGQNAFRLWDVVQRRQPSRPKLRNEEKPR